MPNRPSDVIPSDTIIPSDVTEIKVTNYQFRYCKFLLNIVQQLI